jgi:UDP-N-acetylmuramoylalanine--D-glutamate ligase
LLENADAWVEDDHLMIDDKALLPVSEIALSGAHNIANAMAAALAASALGVPVRSIAASLRDFQGLAHRHRTVHAAGGVRWVDDSKATNVGATLAALRGYPDRSVHLILGGLAKGQDFSVLVPEVRRAAARVYLIGEDGPAIGKVLGEAAEIEDCTDLATAVSRARSVAGPGQWVLLAPACASFDQFADFAERGDRFAELAREEVATCP